jgi:hypothetical protein
MNRNSGLSVEVHHGPTTTIAEVRVDDFMFTGEAKLHPKDERAGLSDSWIGEAHALSRAFQLAADVLGAEAQYLVDALDGAPTEQWLEYLFTKE